MKKGIVFFSILMLLFLCGCGTAQVKKDVLKSIKITSSDTKVKVGKTVNLTAQCISESGKNMDCAVEWTLDNTKLGTLSDTTNTSTVLNAKKAGTVTVKAAVGEIYDEIKITITK